jgi:hypothetical protein
MDGVLSIKKILERKYEEYVLSELDKFKDRTGKQMIYKPSNLMGFEKGALEWVNTSREPQIPKWEHSLKDIGILETEFVINANSRCMERGIPLDFDCSMVVFYYHKKVYVQFFNFNRKWDDVFKELRKIRKIKDWHYQDQADKPDNVSEKTWVERENVWEGIFKEHEADTPAQCGFSVNFNNRLQHIIMRWYNLLYRGSLDAW